VLLWATSPTVTAVMALLFSALPVFLGRMRGYLAAFAFYWLGFGFAFPLLVVGPRSLLSTLRPVPLPSGLAAVWIVAALAAPPLLAGVAVFRVRLREMTSAILLASAAIAVVNAAAEELLWRGAFVRTFGGEPVLGFLVPALGFAVWHLAPQIVLPSAQRGGPAAFVAGALFLGLCWGAVAYVTGSIALTFVSHALTDFLGLGGFAYLRTRSGEPAALAV